MREQNSNNDEAILRFMEGDMGREEATDFIESRVHNTKELWILAKMMKDFRIE